MNPSEFRNPGCQFRGVALWMLNDKLEIDEIVRQLDGMAEAGWGAVIGRTFNGLMTEYLSDEWMAIIGAIVDRARTHGMRVWLQAGYMPSAVPDLDPAVAHMGLARREKNQPVGDDEVVLAEDDQFAYIERTETTVLDLLNSDAVADYLDLAYKQPWYSRFGDEFGKTIEAVWVDEPMFRPPLLPWSSRIGEQFRSEWGYDIAGHLPSLFREVGDYQKVRHHYWRTVAAMFVENYFKRVGQWCAEHDVKFSGHLMGEDTLKSQIGWTGATMPCYEHMQLPGIDHLTMSLRWPSGKKFLLTPKQCTSVASQLGIAETLAEVYAVSSQAISFEDRKEIAQWMAVLGINTRCYHGAFYSMRGRRKRIYVPHLSYQMPWWPDNRIVADYFARLSYALRRGTTRAEVLVLHPIESVMGLYDPTTMDRPHDRSTEAGDDHAMDTFLVDLCDHLLGIQRSWEFGDETLMASYGKASSDGLTVGRMTYPTVILPWMKTIRRTTLALLEAFIAAGGTVLSVGEFPTRVDGAEDASSLATLAAKVQKVENDPAALRAALDDACPAEIEIKATGRGNTADVWVHSRQTDDGRLVYVANTCRTAGVEAELRIAARGKLEEWDLATGDITTPPQRTDGECTVTPLRLAAVGSTLLLLKEDAAPVEVPDAPAETTRTVPLALGGRLRRHDPNALPLDTCRWRKGDGPWQPALPVIAIQALLDEEQYHGPLDLAFAFTAETVPANLCVVIEEAAEYDIRVNGQAVACAGLPYFVDKSFHPVAIAPVARTGENTIELSIEFHAVPPASFALASLYETKVGTELESIYLTGDFAVRAEVSGGEARPRCVRLSPTFRLVAERETSSGDLVADGYPFFAGRAGYAETVTLPAAAEGERVVLALPRLDAVVAKVRVNGHAAPPIGWAPYESDITGLVREGDNAIEIEVTSGLRNLLGPHHRSDGEADNTWKTAFDYNTDAVDVEHVEERGSLWVDDYFVVQFGLGGTPQVVYRK